jgi:uncharacterized protein YneF (UPF0154 family)
MTDEIKRLEEHLTALDAFIVSPAHAGYLLARDAEISDIEQRILSTPPISQDAIAVVLMAFGELDCQKEMKQTFEDARATLKARLDEAIDRDNESATTTRV